MRRAAALVRERLLARLLPLTSITISRILSAHPVVEGGVFIFTKGVHVPLWGRISLYGGYLCVPSYNLDRVIIVDTFLDLPHQLILSLVKLEGPLKRCADPAILSP